MECAIKETWRQIMKKLVLVAAVGLLLASAVAYAQMHHGPGKMGQGGMHGMGEMHGRGGMHGSASHGTSTKGDRGPSSLAFQGINAKMHEAMDIAFTGNADVDFVRGMIPHHEGAVDMAKTVIAFGKDLEVKKLAEEIIKAQEGEIARMREWLKKSAP
jgi:uncharacterized protein (DUF305 family)